MDVHYLDSGGRVAILGAQRDLGNRNQGPQTKGKSRPRVIGRIGASSSSILARIASNRRPKASTQPTE